VNLLLQEGQCIDYDTLNGIETMTVMTVGKQIGVGSCGICKAVLSRETSLPIFLLTSSPTFISAHFNLFVSAFEYVPYITLSVFPTTISTTFGDDELETVPGFSSSFVDVSEFVRPPKIAGSFKIDNFPANCSCMQRGDVWRRGDTSSIILLELHYFCTLRFFIMVDLPLTV
jgi:hypothetical protein